MCIVCSQTVTAEAGKQLPVHFKMTHGLPTVDIMRCLSETFHGKPKVFHEAAHISHARFIHKNIVICHFLHTAAWIEIPDREAPERHMPDPGIIKSGQYLSTFLVHLDLPVLRCGDCFLKGVNLYSGTVQCHTDGGCHLMKRRDLVNVLRIHTLWQPIFRDLSPDRACHQPDDLMCCGQIFRLCHLVFPFLCTVSEQVLSGHVAGVGRL